MKFRSILLCLLTTYLALSIALGILVVHFTLNTPRLDASAEHTEPGELHPTQITAQDGVILRAWYVQPEPWNGRAALLLHGVGDNRTGMSGYAKFLLAHGYSVLLPDSRAHGESGGTLVTYGLLEREDVRRWVNWLYATNGTQCVYGLGESMGAGIVLQALAVNTPFCAVVAESPFATFREAAYDREGPHLHMGPWFGRTIGRPSIEAGLLYARLRYGLDLAQASPAKAVAGSDVPVLLIHGIEDRNLLPRHSELLHRIDSKYSELWLAPKAQHTGAYGANPAEFENRVLGWFSKHQQRAWCHADAR